MKNNPLNKNHIKIVFIMLFALSLTAQTVIAGKDFNGIISYKITYEQEGMSEQMLAMLPSTMTVIIKGDKSKTTMNTPMGNQTSIFDGSKMLAINLLDMMGQKFAIRQSLEEIEEERTKYSNVIINYLEETKEIAGYSCKMANVTVNHPDFNGKATLVVYYTDELGDKSLNYSEALFNEIDGVKLKYAVFARILKIK